MNELTPKSEYMLLFRGSDWVRRLPPEERESVVAAWSRWFERLIEEGRCTDGHPLHDDAVVVSRRNDRVVVDGPFAESKEAIGGYFYLRVASMEEAVEIARQCPGLDYGCVVEVRPVAERCLDRLHASERTVRRDDAVEAASAELR